MITNSKLLIDRDCPLCQAYGHLFERVGLIDRDVIDTYQEIDMKYTRGVDMQRAKSEIALVDMENQEINYGVDSFAKILFHRHRHILELVSWQPIHFLLRLIYTFISLNRHVIVRPSALCSSRACDPPLHYGYRTVYTLLTAIVTGFVLTNYFGKIMSGYSIALPAQIEYYVCFGQVIWQGHYVFLTDRRQLLNYLGHMSTISLGGALLLLPPLAISSFLQLSPIYLLVAFTIVALMMVREHLSRCKRLGLGVGTTLSWVTYRLCILIWLTSLIFG